MIVVFKKKKNGTNIDDEKYSVLRNFEFLGLLCFSEILSVLYSKGVLGQLVFVHFAIANKYCPLGSASNY